MSSGVGSLVEGEDSDRVLAQVALVSGVTIGPQVWRTFSRLHSLFFCGPHRVCWSSPCITALHKE